MFDATCSSDDESCGRGFSPPTAHVEHLNISLLLLLCDNDYLPSASGVFSASACGLFETRSLGAAAALGVPLKRR